MMLRGPHRMHEMRNVLMKQEAKASASQISAGFKCSSMMPSSAV